MPDRNLILKKSLDKIVSQSLERDKSLGGVETIEVTFLFRAPVRTAMCDWVYGIKIKTNEPYLTRDQRVRDFQLAVRKITDQKFNQTVCCSDVIFEKD